MNAQQAGSPVTARTGNGDRFSQTGDIELFLRFLCPACKRVLQVPLRSLGQSAACLNCKTPVQIPSLDHNVVGMETVRRIFEPAHTAASGTNHRQPAPPPASPSVAKPEREKPAATASTPPPPPPPPRIPPQQVSAWSKPIEEPVDTHSVEEHQPVYDGRQRQSRGGGLQIPRAAHWTSRGIYVGVLIILFFCIGLSSSFAMLTLIWLIPFVGWKISQFITSLLITTYSCPGCSEVFPCVDVWKCSCGYQDHGERHVINFRCPLCHGRIGRTNCARCGATILLW